MNAIAVCVGPVVIYWSSIVIVTGFLAALALSLVLQRANGGSDSAMLLFFALTVALSVPLCRALHWYCHTEQYDGFLSAVTDYSSGSFCLPGALLGVWLSALIVKKLGLVKSTARLLDAFAPGAALCAAFIRLSALFNTSCRGKIAVSVQAFQRLPFASAVATASGGTEYRFASFYAEFLLLLLTAAIVLRFFYRNRARPMKNGGCDGHAARLFLLLYSAAELLIDSTRNDSSFLKSNGFVSIVQIISAVCIAALLVYYSRNSIKADGFSRRCLVLWLFWLLGLAGTGASEYLVQRHGNWYLSCYVLMAVCCTVMTVSVYRMYLSCRRE